MNDFFDDITWEDFALLGSLSEELADAEKRRRILEEELEKEECECCCEECDPCDPPDEPYEPPDEDP